MKIVSRLKEAWHKLRKGKPKPVDGVIFEERTGRVDLLVADDFFIRLELFKEYKDGNKWGFELSAVNRSDAPGKEVVISFNRNKGVRFTDIPADGLRIKSIEFSNEEMRPNTMLLEVFRIVGNEKKKASFVVPLDVVFAKLRETGKLKSIESGSQEKELEKQKEVWKAADSVAGQSMVDAQPAQVQPRMKEAAELESRAKDLETQKQNLAKSFMKREVSYTEYSQLMTTISKEMLEIRTKLDKMKNNEGTPPDSATP